MQKCSKEALKLKLDNDAIKKSMLLYAITDRGWLKEGETLESVVEDVLKSGATFLQLREKTQGHEEIVKTARNLQTLCKKYNVPFVVNDDIMAAKEIDADGVHIGQSDMEYTKAREILGPDKIIGVSAGNLAEAKEAFPEEMFVRFPDVNWVTKEQKLARGLVVKRLTISQVNAIAHLQETDELVKNILAFLFEGKPVLVLTPIPSVTKNSRLKYRLKQTIQENVDMCQQFGLIFYHDSENYAVFQAACQKQLRSLAETKRTYITEKQLIRMTEAGVSLSKNAYLTPLAKDYARKHQLLT